MKNVRVLFLLSGFPGNLCLIPLVRVPAYGGLLVNAAVRRTKSGLHLLAELHKYCGAKRISKRLLPYLTMATQLSHL